MLSPSPFLRREERRTEPRIQFPSYEAFVRFEIERARAKHTLERLRYKGYVRAGTLGRFMQVIGNFGRKVFPFIGTGGWNGFGGGRIGS